MKNSTKRKGAILKEKIASEASYGSDKNQRSIQYIYEIFQDKSIKKTEILSLRKSVKNIKKSKKRKDLQE